MEGEMKEREGRGSGKGNEWKGEMKGRGGDGRGR